MSASAINFHNGAMKDYSYTREVKLRRQIRREWADAGYHPGLHWKDARHAGEVNLLFAWMACERPERTRRASISEYRSGRAGGLAQWAASMDMAELVQRLGNPDPLTYRVRQVVAAVVDRYRRPLPECIDTCKRVRRSTSAVY